MSKKNIIIVTGASSGMGKEFVKQVDVKFPKVDEIWLIARRKESLEELSKISNHRCRVLDYDLCEKQALEEIKMQLETEQPEITMLVNSAGYGILGPFDSTCVEEQTGMVSLNCEALTAMTYLCIPYMRKGGRIIQLASSAAFLP
jgi:short-subunit dehydrogenase